MLLRILVLVALVLKAQAVLGSDPPPVKEPPALLAATEITTDAKKACVSVWNAHANANGQRYGGSGVCIATEGGKSVVLTNNHIFSDQHHPAGGFRDDIYPLPATVVVGGKEHKAVALSADRDADVCVVIVDAELVPAKVADSLPAPGAKVWRNGNGSGYQVCKVIDSEASADRLGFVVEGKSESGDSGSAYFNEANEFVALHCGKDAAGRPRGTPVTVVKTVTKTRTPLLFPRLRARLGAATATKEPPALPMTPPKIAPKKVNAPCACGDACTCPEGVCPKCPTKKVEPPKAAPKPKTVLWLVNGRYYELPEGQLPTMSAAPTSSCPGGNCPLPSSTGRFRR